MNKKKIKVVFTGGGTGGHVYPNIAIYEAIRDHYPDASFLYIGTRLGAESRIVRTIPQPIEFVPVLSKGVPQKIKSIQTMVSLFYMLLGTVKSFFVLRRFKPDIIIGSGGYVAAPVLLAASILKLSVFIHEQNAVPGRLNRFIARFATRIGVSFPSTAKFFPEDKVVVTGYPLRKKIVYNKGENIKEKYRIPEKNKVIFIFGGSGGARSINTAVAEILPMLLAIEDLTVILSTGRGYSKEYKAYDDTVKILEKNGLPVEIPGKLIIHEYFDNIDEIYSITDLVVSRAGAGTIKEITTIGIPSILIPKIDLPGDHQILNANEVQKIGGAKVVYEEVKIQANRRMISVPESKLLEVLKATMFEGNNLFNMKKNLKQVEKHNSTDLILKEIEQIIEKKEKVKERQIKVFYLQSEDEEKSFELIFDTTTFGNTYLSDVYLENVEEDVLFKIQSLNKKGKLMLWRVRGTIKVNGQEVEKWVELKEDDEIGIQGRVFVLKSYFEKLQEYASDKTLSAKMMGSSMGIVVSRLGGFLREIFTAAYFGAGRAMDIFAIGLTLSNFIRRIVAENALENAFLPIFLRLFHRRSRQKTWEASASIVNTTLVISFCFTVIGILVAPFLIKVLFPRFIEQGIYVQTVNMTRLMFPYLFLVTIAAVMTTYLKAFNRFGLAEASAIFFSIGTILGIVLFSSVWGMYSLAVGILIGGIIQILFLLPIILRVFRDKRVAFSYKPLINFTSSTNKKYYAQLGPVSFDVLLAKTSEIVDRVLAHRLEVGSISFLYFSQTIFRLPFAIISQAINSVLLKEFSDNIALYDKQKARRLFLDGIKINLFLLVPISILMLMLAVPLVSLLLERSNFSTADVSYTAFALQFYAIGLTGWGIHSLTVRIFSARIDIKTSVLINIFMLATNISLCIILVRTPLRYAGLALATSISYLLFSILRVAVLKMKLEREQIVIRWKEILTSLCKTMAAAVLMVVVLFESRVIFGKIQFVSKTVENMVLLVSLSFIGISIYFLVSLLLRNTDVLFLRNRLLKRKRADVPISLLSPFQFLDKVGRQPDQYYDDYSYKINIYTSSSSWEVRNVGIKLIGIFKDKEKVSYLLEVLNSAGVNGFIKRNALIALRQLDIWNPEMAELVERLLHDPYYEVRVAAIDYLRECVPARDYAQFKEIIRRKLKRATWEEKIACMKLLARMGDVEDLPYLEDYFLNSNSLLREELLELIHGFYRRKLLTPQEVKGYIEKILITSNNLSPEFRLRSLIKKIYREIE